MDKTTVVNRLLAYRNELEQLGVMHVSVFGSTARGEAKADSDVDVAVTLDPEKTPNGLAYFGRLNDIQERLQNVLGSAVDVVQEPAQKPRLQAAIDRDRLRAF
jgi:predicted nucleotidyltransferase